MKVYIYNSGEELVLSYIYGFMTWIQNDLIQLVYKHTDKSFAEFGSILNQIWIVITISRFGAN